MLEAIFAACERIRLQNEKVFVLYPTQFGFKKGENAKDQNVDLVSDAFNVCAQKQLELNTAAICNGGESINGILNGNM